MSGLIISEVVPGLLDVYFPFLVCRYKRGGLRVLLVGQVPGLTVCGGGGGWSWHELLVHACVGTLHIQPLGGLTTTYICTYTTLITFTKQNIL